MEYMENLNTSDDLRTNDEVVFLSPWLKKTLPKFCDRLTILLADLHIEWHFLPKTNDIWCRDFMPLALADSRFLLYRYYPDYLLKKDSDRAYITDGAEVCKEMNLRCDRTNLVIDGGNMVRAGNYLIMTRKILYENAHLSASEVMQEMERLTNLKLLLLPWDRFEKYGHSDGIVRSVDEHTVVMTNYADFNKTYAKMFAERLSKHFKVITLSYDVPHLSSQSWAYINYLEIGNTMIIPALGIAEDIQAFSQFKKLFPHRKVAQIRMEEVVKKGGALNCLTWTLKKEVYLRNSTEVENR